MTIHFYALDLQSTCNLITLSTTHNVLRLRIDIRMSYAFDSCMLINLFPITAIKYSLLVTVRTRRDKNKKIKMHECNGVEG